MWEPIFPDGRLPITGPAPLMPGRFPYVGLSPYYKLDRLRVTDEQMAAIVKALSVKFNLLEKEVLEDIEVSGIPVLASATIVSYCPMHSRMAIERLSH
jgi:hypothetical protein